MFAFHTKGLQIIQTDTYASTYEEPSIGMQSINLRRFPDGSYTFLLINHSLLMNHVLVCFLLDLLHSIFFSLFYNE